MKEGGGIPQRYKNMGFTHVGQKKQGDGQHKWKVLAKKGSQYKVVQGGYRGMQDYSQHHSKKRQSNFWSRMGGKSSSKAKDPFSPLYWHKRLGKWEDGGMMFREVAGGDISIPNLTKLQVGGYFPRFMQDGGLPKYQADGWVQRAANAKLKNNELCRTYGRADMGDGRGGGSGGREDAPISGYDHLSDLSNDAWFDSDRLKEIKRSRPEGVDKQMWNAINAEARRLNNSYTNKYVWGDYADPKTGRLDPKYLLPENKDKVNIPSYYPYYENTPLKNNKSINPQDIYQYYMGQPGGLESFKTLINNNYMPQKKNGGTNNKGFKSLPPYVQNKILSRMDDGGYTGTFSGNAYYQQGGMPQQPQQGGGQDQQIMQLIQAYAQIAQVDPKQIMQQLQQMQPQEQQQALQQMAQTVQQASSGGGQEQAQEQPQMQDGGIPCYNCGGSYQYGGQMGGSYMPSMPAVSIYDLPIYQETGEVVTPRWHPEWNDQQYSDEALSGQYDTPVDPQQLQLAPDFSNQGGLDWNTEAEYGRQPVLQYPQQAAPTPAQSSYQGNSIVDYLANAGSNSSYASRKALAREKGILDYRGTAAQNLELLDILKGGKTTIPKGNVSARSAAKKAEANSTTNEQAENEIKAPYDANDGNILRKGWEPTLELQKGAFQRGLPNKNNKDGISNSALLWGTAGMSALLASAALTNKELQEVKDKFLNNDFTKEFSPTVKRKFTIARNKLANQVTTKGGQDAKAVADLFKKTPKELQKLLDHLDSMEIKGDIHLEPDGAGQAEYKRWMDLKKEIANERKLAKKNAKLFGKDIVPTAEVAATEGRGFMDAVRAGYGAMREAPMVTRLAKLSKYFRKEDGGGIDDDINEMQRGGWNVGSYHVPDWVKTGVEIVDPTGISSYGDVYDSYEDLYNNPSWGNAGSALLETLSALPVVGKVGKAAKATSKLGKIYRGAEKVLSPISKLDRMNPIGAGVGAFNRTMLQGAPAVVRGAAQIGSDFNQGRRFFTGAEAGVHGLDHLMGYKPQYAYGGYMDPAWMAEGGIHINPANRGKFTASAQRAGMGVQEFAGHVLANKEDYSSTQVKRANFARNASKWKHQEGGSIGVGSYVDDTPEMRAWLDANGYTYE
jgi:hypothetical protein